MVTMTVEDLARITGANVSSNLVSVHAGLALRGAGAGLNQQHRLADYLAQLSHESQGFIYDREIWGPTAAQKRYEGRSDLGNNLPGDGSLFRGRTAIQITGRYNTTEFRDWCRRMVDSQAPDFAKNPDLMNTDPWEGLGPIWYWETRNLIRFSDLGEFDSLTRAINGGLNGAADRQSRWDYIALRMLGYDTLRDFQREHQLVVDGLFGPISRLRMRSLLRAGGLVVFTGAKKNKPSSSFSLWLWLKGLFHSFFKPKA